MKNIGYNLLGAALPILVAIFTIPLYTKIMGLENYGLIAITWLFIGYTSALDAGLSRASARELSIIGSTDNSLRKSIFLSVLWVILALGLLGGVLLYAGLSLFVPSLPATSNEAKQAYTRAIPLIAAAFPLILASGVPIGALESRGQFLLANSISSLGMILGQVLPLIAAVLVDNSLDFVLAVSVVIRAATAATLLGAVAYVERIDTVVGPDLKSIRRLLSFGGWVSVSNVLSPIMSSVDGILVARLTGAGQLPYYSVPLSTILRVGVLPNAVARALFPRFASQPREETLELATNWAIVLVVSLGAMASAIIPIGQLLLTIWLGPDFGEASFRVAHVLLIGLVGGGTAIIPAALLQATGRPKVVALTNLAELPIYLALLLGLTALLGVIGAALAWSIRAFLDCLLLLMFARILRQLVGPIIAVGCFCTAVLVLSGQFAPANYGAAIVQATLAPTLLVGCSLLSRRIRRAVNACLLTS